MSAGPDSGIIKATMTRDARATTSSIDGEASTLEERRVHALRERFPQFEFADMEVALAVGRASVVLDRALADEVKPYGLTPVGLQALISVFLAGPGPLSLAGLGDELRVTKANVSLVLGALERQELIRRRTDPDDGRKIRARLTDRGEKLLVEIMPGALEAVGEKLGTLPEPDRATLKRLARHIR